MTNLKKKNSIRSLCAEIQTLFNETDWEKQACNLEEIKIKKQRQELFHRLQRQLGELSQ